VLYLLFVLVLGFMASTYRRFRDLEHQITILTRRLALDEAVLPEQSAAGEVADSGRPNER
jgi:hypothetical protein